MLMSKPFTTVKGATKLTKELILVVSHIGYY